MSDNWTDVLRQLQPDYDVLQDVLDNGLKIRARMHRVNFAWRVRIEEDWDHSDGELYYTADDGKLDSRCEWAAEQLNSWKTATRLSHQEWKFLRRKDAEKFITLYSLKWAE